MTTTHTASNKNNIPQKHTSKGSPIFDRYTMAVMKNVWWLSLDDRKKLTKQETYRCSLRQFLDATVIATYPHSHEDVLKFKERTYRISYINTSAEYLDDLLEASPEEKVCFQLRCYSPSGFYYCLVMRDTTIDDRAVHHLRIMDIPATEEF